jgi:DNA mismatch repair protein MutS
MLSYLLQKKTVQTDIMMYIPKIQINSNKNSFLNATKLRHPLVEKILQKESYIPVDIHLGFDHTQTGILLFSLNAAGKSVCMKAVGISIIMAQAGMFVPAENFTFSPFKKLFTRISGNDNIFKGKSSFAVEMSELNSILRRADSNSLVIGDEICHGTEHYSGGGIIAQSIITLAQKQIPFIFATHMHHLNKIKELNNLQNVQRYHFAVRVENDRVIYDRKLVKGQGESIYGIEVASAMGFGPEFIKNAKKYRNILLGQSNELFHDKSSKYNSSVFINSCEICNKKPNPNTNEYLDTHHIKFQCTADDSGFINEMHKNHRSNLVVLCKDCHQNVHSGKIIISGYKQSSNGYILEYNKK